MNNSISFGAKFINIAQIKKLSPQTKSYTPQDVSVIEIDPDNIQDIFALSDAARNWIYEKYASNISYTANCLFQNIMDRRSNKVFAITEQLNNLDNLNDEKLLGMANIKKTGEKSIELHYIQVKPDYPLMLGTPQTKGVGTRILDSLKLLYDKIELTAAKGSVKDFYKKNGFKVSDETKNTYIWEKT